MVRSNNKQSSASQLFLLVGIVLLATGMIFGLIGGIQYIIPGFLKQHLSFERIRPLHVSSVVFWIILAATGGVLTYVQQHTGKKIYSALLVKIQLLLFSLSVIFILSSYAMGFFGGREYWEFPPVLAIPVTIGWILFLINFFGSIGSLKSQPVYVWMWATGAISFLFTYLESYLWLFPYFRNNIVNDMTIQWKSYGSIVGSWNMLIYGSSIFLMDKISNTKTYSRSGTAFALYFLGLFNLMFNWGHHIYTLPTHSYVKYIGYTVSMTELILLGRIIYQWKSTVTSAKKNYHYAAYRLLIAADIWIFLTLLLAIAMSVPAINLYTHGTHITVAHTMGATIGINTFLLLAIAQDILKDTCKPYDPYEKLLRRGYWTANVSLFFFWISLIAAGVCKSKWQMSTIQVPFRDMMLQLRPFLISFVIFGTTLMIGLLMIVYPIVKNQFECFFSRASKKEKILSRRARAFS